MAPRCLAGGGDTDELTGWSWSFTSDEFEVEWSLDFLRRLLGAGVSVGPDHMVAERLAALSDDYPAACIEALQLLIEAGIGSEEPITTILVTALAAGGDAGRRGRDPINVLVARGAIGFRGLLPGGGG